MGQLIKVRKTTWTRKTKRSHALYNTSTGEAIIKRNMLLYNRREKRLLEDKKVNNSNIFYEYDIDGK